MGYSETNVHRKKKIEDCLLSLMQEMPYEEITVKDLAEKLRIARKTFYHYFPNKQECLKSLTERLLYECMLQAMQEAPQEDMERAYRCRMQYWVEHKDYLDAINRNKLGFFFLNSVMAFASKEVFTGCEKPNAPDQYQDEDIRFFYLSGQVLLLLKWAEADFPLSMDDMVKKYLRCHWCCCTENHRGMWKESGKCCPENC